MFFDFLQAIFTLSNCNIYKKTQTAHVDQRVEVKADGSELGAQSVGVSADGLYRPG